jgi:hypothetical protein
VTPELKKQWIDALRSGKYKQAREMLIVDKEGDEIINAPACEGVGFCCLGVLGALINPERVQYPDMTELGGHAFMTMNDAKRMSFDEIADYVEKNL